MMERPFEHLLGGEVLERGHLHGLGRDLVGQVRRDHHHALAVADDDVAREDRPRRRSRSAR